jgi:hypothetical protein
LKYERSHLKRLLEMNPSSVWTPNIFNKEWQTFIMYWNSLEQMATLIV